MDKHYPRKRTSTAAKNSEIKFGSPKIIKQDIKLDKLSKLKLVERCTDLENALKELNILKSKSDREIENLKERIHKLENTKNKITPMSTENTQTYPINDVDFNCGVCIYQTPIEQCLWDHMDNEHDVQRQTEIHKIKCKNCEEKFENKSDLASHVKQNHEMSKKHCKYFAKGTCMFSKESCWYLHDEKSVMEKIIEIKCNFCDEKFNMKSDFMKHRKYKHSERVALCRDNSNNSCQFDQHCWYNHGKEYQSNENDLNSITKTLEVLQMLGTRITSMESAMRMETS